MKKTIIIFLLFICLKTFGQIGIGTAQPQSSAMLEVFSTSKGFLPPRLTITQRDSIENKVGGLTIYNTDLNCMQYWNTTKWIGDCSQSPVVGIITSIDCANVNNNGTLISGTMASGVSSVIPYTGGNGGIYPAASFNSTGVTGLIASLSSGVLNTGNGNFVFDITGIPSSAGNASFNISVAGETCTFTIPVITQGATVGSLNCGSAVFSPAAFTSGTSYSGTLKVPYTGGNGGNYSQISFTNNGLTFTLPAGTLGNGNGNLVYNVTGIPMSAGAISIPISFGGKSCNVTATVAKGSTVILPGNPKGWMRHNLGANTSLDPDVPVQAIHGNYYQWGRATVVANASTPVGAISGWNTAIAPDNSWQDGAKTANDPCPAGFRIPTRQQFSNLTSNNASSNVGTWTPPTNPTNFGSAKVFGSGSNILTLPATGIRSEANGELSGRGTNGNYWSSTQSGTTYANYLALLIDYPVVSSFIRPYGMSIRCIAE
ncbi:FISUMP domain-containing protein [Chryseobacterium sp. JUb7]|uniref:FISUMP domain-containing protein n=1 Tax=Chryseobacterium sp. JUb7 TaxID=2940599 RepID=UPI00216A01D9|nr:FISUMP domain-containing protein [Chryseobacterium sp. JUb7]MCS3533094.1 uncharacterized protein (TIGR02145 family) [Chryseobacterium sp. JUb7]